MNPVKHMYRFLRYNRNKFLSVYALVLSAYYRFIVLCLPMSFLQKKFGTRGMESSTQITTEQLNYAKRVSIVTNRICNQTKWQSKCLIRAMVAQRLLYRKCISTTLYLGVKKEESRLIAHAWLRTGSFSCTGGTGEDYTVVAKFRK